MTGSGVGLRPGPAAGPGPGPGPVAEPGAGPGPAHLSGSAAAAGRGGFSLVEAIVALTISSAVVVLVSTVFLVQNEYYALQRQRSAAQDNARSVTELLAAEIRSAMKGGVVTAENRELALRSPIVLAVVCARQGNNAYVQFPGGAAELPTAEVAGVALRNDTTGEWTYRNASWSALNGNAVNAAQRCEANGADTVGARGEFWRLRRLRSYFGSVPPPGTVLMLFRETRFRFQQSVLDTSMVGLFRAAWGDTLVEYATGMDSTAAFLYRTGGSSYATRVQGNRREDIDAIRIVAEARTRAPTGGRDEVTYGWSVNVPLRNVR